MSDPHVTAVVENVEQSATVVLDLSEMMTTVVSHDVGLTVLLDLRGEPVSITSGSSGTTRGWIRRISPDGWDHGIVVGSKEAADYASRLVLLSAIANSPAITWLSNLENILRAENKLMQAKYADNVGALRPSTVVTGEAADIAEFFPRGDVVVKPLGPSDYYDEAGRTNVAYAQRVAIEELKEVSKRSSPFIVQQLLDAKLHLRIVTVAGKTWAAALGADERPLDWRVDAEAHSSFEPFVVPPRVLSDSLGVARGAQIGYSSQDWILTTQGDYYFLDLNPGGQWLFLPDTISIDVTSSLAMWLQK